MVPQLHETSHCIKKCDAKEKLQKEVSLEA